MKELEKPIFINNEKMFYIIGVLIGDGNILINRIRVGVKDHDFIKNIKINLEEWLKHPIKIVKRPNKTQYNNYNGFLYHIGFNSIKLSKFINSKIKKLEHLNQKNLMIKFLEGLYDSEGHVDKGRLRIRISMQDKKIMKITSLFLKKLKINHTYNNNYKNKGKSYTLIRIYDKNCIIFHNLIHFSIFRKEKRLVENINLLKRKQQLINQRIKESKKSDREEWCKKFNKSKQQYYRYKRGDIKQIIIK